MNDSDEPQQHAFEKTIGDKARRKIEGEREKETYSAWFGLGMFGLIGWSVAVPAVVMTAIGVWLDAHSRESVSWTLTFLFIGIVIGCLNAWWWIERKRKR